MAWGGLRRTPVVLGIIPLPAPDSRSAALTTGAGTELGWTLAVLDTVGHLCEIVIAPCREVDPAIPATVERCFTHTRIRLQDPAPDRLTAIARALAAAPPSDRVLVQSPERPQSPASISAAILDTRFEGVVLSVPAKSTFKRVAGGVVRGTFPRETLVHLLGPAVFDRSLIEDALARDREDSWACGDEIALARRAGIRLRLASREHFDPSPSLSSAFEFLDLATWSVAGIPALET
ncbi:MAG: 2-C-methyl-D-erythritol 4-phosphate cytidylyltransferase [Candidatus Dormibacteraceae bacterium]